MTRSITRKLPRTLLLAGASLAVLAGPAMAQNTPAPEHYTLDPRGVDLVRGKFNIARDEVSVGQPETGGLVYRRYFTGDTLGSWRDTTVANIYIYGSTYAVSIGEESEIFIKSGSTYTPQSNTGATLTQSGSTYTFTSRTGVVSKFKTIDYTRANHFGGSAIITDMTLPNGDVRTYNYVTGEFCSFMDWDGNCIVYQATERLQSVTSSSGYQLHFNFETDDSAAGQSWLQIAGVAAVPLGACDPFGGYCYAGTSVTFYPNAARPTHITDSLGRTTVLSYAVGGVSSVTAPGESSPDVTITYDSNNKVASVTGATGAWTYGYSASGATQTTTVSGPLGQGMTVQADTTIGRATSVTNALSQTTTYAYDSDRRLDLVTLPEGNTVDLSYDARGNLTQTTWGAKPGSGLASLTTSAVYPSSCSNAKTCNKPTSTTDARGATTDYTYDSGHGGVLTVTQPAPTSGAARPQTRYGYTGVSGFGATVTVPYQVSACATGSSCIGTSTEIRTTLGYDTGASQNRMAPRTVTTAAGDGSLSATTAMTYDYLGDVVTVDGPLSGTADTTTYGYDWMRQPTLAVGPDPDGSGSAPHRAQRVTYNGRGQVTLSETGTVPSPSGTFTPLVKAETVYDGFGRPVVQRGLSASNAVASVSQTSYDAGGRVDCTTMRMNPSAWSSLPSSACTAQTAGSDGPDRIVQATYDALGRPLSTTSAVGQAEALTESTTYTTNGQVQTLTDGNGNVSTMVYDGHDRTVELRYPNAAGGGSSTTDKESYGYDANGNVTAFTSRGGSAFATTYDALNRPTLVDAPSGTMDVATTYDNLGRVLTRSGNSQTLTTTWDALGRMISEAGPLGTMAYQYDLAGRRTRITWPDALYVAYDWNVAGDMTAIRENGATSGAGVLATYGHNNLGQITAITRGNGATTSQGYDSWYRLSSLSHDLAGTSADVTFGYTYNHAGQISQRTVSNPGYVYTPAAGSDGYSVNGRNQYTAVDGTTPTYDANQNITSALGNSFGYDAANRLTSATISGNSYGFSHDPADRLYNHASAGIRYQYAGLQTAAEYDSAGNLLVHHIPGPGLDQPVMTLYAGQRYQQIADERGSVVAVTDAAAAASINTYDEYGVANAGSLFQYTGQTYLAPGLYNYRARIYMPQIGRFLQTDPIGYEAGANLYAYVGNDPVNWVDPLGLTPTCYRVTFAEGEEYIAQVPCDDSLKNGGGSNSGYGGTTFNLIGRGSGGDGGIARYFPSFPASQNRSPVDPGEAQRWRDERDRAAEENAWVAEPILWLIPGTPAIRGWRALSAANRLCNCFVAGTQVQTEDGLKPIESIQVGDLVLARDEVTGETAYKPVAALIDGAERVIWEVTVQTADASGRTLTETFGTTDEHPWRIANGRWAETADLRPGLEIVTEDGDRAVILSVTETDRREQTYNFEVEGFHTYFIGEAELWVHNACWKILERVRGAPGRDGGISKHIIELRNGRTNSVTHQVTTNGRVTHQHQTHTGQYGSQRQFPDQWIQYPNIGF